MRKRFTNQFKTEVVLELLRGYKTIRQIASMRRVAATQLSQWRSIALKSLPSLFDDDQRGIQKAQAAHDAEREKLFAELGRTTSELNFLNKRWPQS